MKASIYGIMSYVTPQDLPQGWPLAPVNYDAQIGKRNFDEGIAQLELADQIGFDWVSFSEHHYSNVSVAPHPALIGAAVVSRIRNAKIAILGHVLPLNNPVRVAEELAMLDNLSNGRVVVGLLRGTPNEYQVYGANPGETRDMALESMELILKTWTEPQPFGWEGRHYRYRTVSAWPRPLQSPHPPVYVLGTSKESCEFAARHHLGLGVSFDRFELFVETIQHYRDQCAINGWLPTADHVLYRGRAYVAETDEKAEEDVRLYWTRAGGINLRMRETVASAVASLDANPRDPNAGYGGIVRRPQVNFIGGPESVFKQLKQCSDLLGAGVVDLYFQGPALEHEKVMRSIELFGSKVLPRIHAEL